MLPDLAEAAQREKLDEALRAAAPANLAAFLIVCGSTLLVIMAGRFGLGLFGEEFASAHWALVIAVLGLAPRAIAGPSLRVLVVLARYKASILAGSASLAFLTGATLLLVPLLGVTGAAVAFAGTGLFSATLSGVLLWRLEGARSDLFASSWRRFLRTVPA